MGIVINCTQGDLLLTVSEVGARAATFASHLLSGLQLGGVAPRVVGTQHTVPPKPGAAVGLFVTICAALKVRMHIQSHRVSSNIYSRAISNSN